jgi:hypothetical protein
MVDPARGVVVCRRVWRREPFSNLLFYLVPCSRVSVFTTQAVEVADHKQDILSISSLAFLTSAWTKFSIK